MESIVNQVRELIEKFSEDSPVKSATIEKAFNIPGSIVRDCVRELRESGYQICSSSKGYFVTTSRKAFKQSLKETLLNRANSMVHTYEQSMINSKKRNKQLKKLAENNK